MEHYYSLDHAIGAASSFVDKLSESKQKRLKESIEHGCANIDSDAQLKMYLHLYGDIHRHKLELAFNHIPQSLWEDYNVSLFDYGCGQGIAEMALYDFLRSKDFNHRSVKEITLIEESKANLDRANQNAADVFHGVVPVALHKSVADVTENEVFSSNASIHIFSNVIDIPDFPREHIANLLSNKKNSVVICVSPFYPNPGRGQHMKEFGKLLKGYERYYKLEKHSDDWSKDHSCQLHIYISRN